MKTDEEKQKEAKKAIFWLPVTLCIGLFIKSWRETHSVMFATLSAVLGTVAGMIAAIAFALLWARTHSIIIAFLVTAAGCAAILIGLGSLWNWTHP